VLVGDERGPHMSRQSIVSRLHEVQHFVEERPRTQKEIADYFAINRQTVRRCIDRLSVYATISEYRDGRNTVYKIEKPPSLNFSPLELSTLIVAQKAIISTASGDIGSPFAESSKSLLNKVRKTIPAALRTRLDAFSEIYGSAITPAKDFSRHFGTIEMLVKAAIDCKYVKLNYLTLGDKSVKERRVAPYNVYFDPDGATLKMLGFDELRQAIIPFSIDHIRGIEILDETFRKPGSHDLRSFLEQNCFNGIHGEPITIKLKLTGVTARIFEERTFHRSQLIVKRSRSNNNPFIIAQMTVARGRGLERFIQSWLPEIEVISPLDLRDKIRETLESSRRAFND